MWAGVDHRLRVAALIHGYQPRLGGAERQLGAIAPRLQPHGVEVSVLTRRFPGLAPFERIEGVPVYRLPAPGPKPVASLAYTLSALLVLRRLRPDLVHAHEMFSAATIATLARRWLGARVVVTPHRSGPLGDVQRLQRKLFGRGRIASCRAGVDMFVTISHEIDAELAAIDIPARRRFRIPNGVDTDRFRPPAPGEKQALRAELGLDTAPVAIFSGRLAPEKRVKHLLSIWPAVRERHPQAQLLILGSGPEQALLKQAARAGVRFAGRIEDVAPYLQAADVFLLPSIAEGLSVALLEALACGLPAIVTGVGGAADVIEPGHNGWLIPPDDVAALQDAVITLLGNSRLGCKLGYAARERVSRDYSLPVVTGQLSALYRRLVDQPEAEVDLVPEAVNG